MKEVLVGSWGAQGGVLEAPWLIEGCPGGGSGGVLGVPWPMKGVWGRSWGVRRGFRGS